MPQRHTITTIHRRIIQIRQQPPHHHPAPSNQKRPVHLLRMHQRRRKHHHRIDLNPRRPRIQPMLPTHLMPLLPTRQPGMIRTKPIHQRPSFTTLPIATPRLAPHLRRQRPLLRLPARHTRVQTTQPAATHAIRHRPQRTALTTRRNRHAPPFIRRRRAKHKMLRVITTQRPLTILQLLHRPTLTLLPIPAPRHTPHLGRRTMLPGSQMPLTQPIPHRPQPAAVARHRNRHTPLLISRRTQTQRQMAAAHRRLHTRPCAPPAPRAPRRPHTTPPLLRHRLHRPLIMHITQRPSTNTTISHRPIPAPAPTLRHSHTPPFTHKPPPHPTNKLTNQLLSNHPTIPNPTTQFPPTA